MVTKDGLEVKPMPKRDRGFSGCPPLLSLAVFLLPVLSLFFFSTNSVAQEGLKLSYEKAQRLFEQRDNAHAVAAFRALLAQTYQDRASLYQQEGLWEKAFDDLTAALKLLTDSKAIRYDLAYTDFRLQHYRQSVSLLEPLADASPADSRAHALLGKALFSLGKIGDSRRELQLALRLDPDDHLTAYTLALADLAGRDKPDADRIFSRLERSLGVSPQLYLVLARAYLDSGYEESACRELDRALAVSPKVRYAHYLLAIGLLREKGREGLEQAERELMWEGRLFPDEFEAQFLLGVTLVFQRRWADAHRALQEAILLDPQQPQTYFYLGNVYLKQGRARQAVESLRKGLNLAKSHPENHLELDRAHLLLSQAYRALGENEASALQARKAGNLSQLGSSEGNKAAGVDSRLSESLAGLSSPSPRVTWKDPLPPAPLTERQKQLLNVYGQVLVSGHNYLARIAVSQQEYGEAARQFAQIRKLQPDYPEVDFRLGLARFKAGQFPQALKPLEDAIEMNPADSSATKYLGLTYFELGRYDKAVELLERARSSSPNDPEILLALGGALARSHRGKEAQSVFGELLKSHPNSAAIHILLGKAYAAQGKVPEAEQEFQGALNLDPQAPSAHLYLGILKLQDGQLAAAAKEFKAELRAHPEALEARYNLAFVLLKQQKVAEAIPLLRRVIQAKPGYAEAYYSLGKALLKEGHTQDAIRELKKAIQLDPKKAYAHYQLGRAYLLVGERKQAEQEFELTRNLKDQQLKFHVPQPSMNP